MFQIPEEVWANTEKDTAHPEYIQTHIGTGYRMIIVKK